MINTIFYFASGQSEYDSNVLAEQISERTISFVPKTSDRGNIYKNNIRYGGVDVDLDYDAIKTVINNWFNSDDPDKPTIPSSGDGGDTPGGGGGNTDPIVPDWVDDRLDELEDKAQHEKERIQEYINNKDLDIRNLIELMFDDYNEMIQNYLETGNPDFQKYTFGDEDTMEWISQLGHVTDNGDGTYSVDWSSILLKVSEIDASVNRIKGALNGQGTEDPSDDTIDYEVLSSKIFAFLGEDYATNGLSSVWARLVNGKLPTDGEQFDPETATLLEWMAADVKTWADSQQAYSDVMAAAREYKDNGKDVLQEAAAGVHALVEKQDDGTYKASATLSSLVDDAYAGVVAESIKDEAIAQVSAQVNAEIDGKIETATSGLTTRVKNIEDAGYIKGQEAESIIATKVANATSSFATKTYVDDAVESTEAAMASRIGDVESTISTDVVKKDGGYISNAKIYADDVTITSTRKLNVTSADGIDISTSTINSLLDNCTIHFKNLDLGTDKIPFDNLNITGTNINTFASSININNLDGQDTFINALNSNLAVKKLIAGGVTADSNGVVVKNSSGNIAGQLLSTGAGSIANGQITWDADGNVTGIGTLLETKLGDELVVKKLTATNGSSSVVVDSSGVVIKPGSNTTSVSLNKDGSGSLAKGNISWDTLGRTTFVGYMKTGLDEPYISIEGGNGLAGNIKIGDYLVLSANTVNGGYLWMNDPDDTSYNPVSISSRGVSMYDPNGNDIGCWLKTSSSTRSFMKVIDTDSNTKTTVSPEGVTTSSDMRLKTVVKNCSLLAESIADAELFIYRPKNNANLTLVGTSAQYWKDVLPEAVLEDDNKYLSLDYAKVATASVISVAREVVKLKEENKSLKERLDAIEARLALLENA